MQLLDQHGRPVQLGREIGRGGEGLVCEVVGRPDVVAKIYHQAPDLAKAQKLACMAAKSSPDLLCLAAWPTAVLFDSTRAPRGITMPLMSGAREIHILYSPAQRRSHFPKADWHFLVRAARNCAASFAMLHKSNVVVGDVNQGNILVNAQALVRLIDCDSFQVGAAGKVYRCPVGVSHFTPPELQSVRFEQVDRAPNHDNFGLAVVLFHLLFMGRHPFAGKFTGRGEMPTIEASIAEYGFAYGMGAARLQLAPPPGSPTLAIVPPEICSLFERAFAVGSEKPGARPSAAEWVVALENLEAALSKCAADPGHVYSRTIASCPWCRLDETSGTHFFASATLDRLNASPVIDVLALWNSICAIPEPDEALQAICPPPLPLKTPLRRPDNIDENQHAIHAIGWSAVAGLSLAVVTASSGHYVMAIALMCVALVAGGLWLYLYRISPMAKERAARAAAVRAAEKRWKRASTAMADQLGRYADEFHRIMGALTSAKDTLSRLEPMRKRQIADLQWEAQTRQLSDFLDRFSIAEATIPGVTISRVAVLSYQGIETAKDIPELWAIAAIPGFDEVVAGRLVQWKEALAARFQFNPSQGLPVSDIQAIRLKFQLQRMKLEASLRQGEVELRRILNTARDQLTPVQREVVELRHELDQARANLKVLYVV